MSGRGLGQFVLGMVIALALSAMALGISERKNKPSTEGFAARVDLAPLDEAAVNYEGRLKSFHSFARDVMSQISGPRRYKGQTPDFTYMDLMIRPEAYADADIVYVKNRMMRARLAELMRQKSLADAGRIAEFEKSGLISEPLLRRPEVGSQMSDWQRDLIRTAKPVRAIMGAVSMMDPAGLADTMRVVPPPGSDAKAAWMNVNDLFPTEDNPNSPAVNEAAPAASDVLDPAKRDPVRNAWADAVTAWRAQDAARVNEALVSFAGALRMVNPELYPSAAQLRWESLYFKYGNLTWVWVLYLAAVIFLLMAVAYKWEGARRIGMGAFFVAFLLHTAALGLRWYVSGRWPNSNMFEAVTTSVWMGTCLALGVEWIARKTPLRNLFVLSGGVASMAALMSARYVPQLDASIRNMMPVLHDLWLYIHTNVIITSYALIAMSTVTALLYLARRAIGGSRDYARAGGAALLVDATGGGVSAARRLSAGEVLDGATMVLMELSFVMLWTGLVMGAIWADHSWGRPWGWDPKEVFALNTFLVFLVLVHVRLKVVDKGLWTAVLAVVGCGVMLFNWIVINFIISGLHSYA